MLSQLKANLGKHIGIELLNGSKVFGTLLEVDGKTLRIDTDEGIAHLLVNSVQIIWEDQSSSLSETDIREILGKVKGTLQTRYVCLGAGGFRCPQNYTCRPPHACNAFSCPGVFNAFVPPPPEEPCIGQFYGFQRSADSEGDKETKE